MGGREAPPRNVQPGATGGSVPPSVSLNTTRGLGVLLQLPACRLPSNWAVSCSVCVCGHHLCPVLYGY